PPFRNNASPAVIDFEAWQRYCVAQNWIEPREGEEPAAATLRGLDAHFRDEWEELRIAIDRPRCRFPVQWEKHVFAPMPHLPAWLRAAQFAAFRANVHLALGDVAAAREEVRVVLRLATVTKTEPTLIAHLVRISIAQLALDTIKRGISDHVWDAEALASLAAELRDLRPLEQYEHALRTERSFGNALYPRLRASGASEFRKVIQFSDGVPLDHRLLGAYPDGWLYDNQVRTNQFTDAMLARVDAEQERFEPAGQSFDVNAKPASWVDSVHYLPFFLHTPVLGSTEIKSLRFQAAVQCGRAALALEQIRITRGSYPPALEAIGDPPRDVINGEPLRYRVNEEDGYVLYSVALNGVDDGGVDGGERLPASQPDWIWNVGPR
ncbi:MAG TPA: hypothetical protein VF551_04230, partial [Chthoniobacterales bacterium]